MGGIEMRERDGMYGVSMVCYGKHSWRNGANISE